MKITALFNSTVVCALLPTLNLFAADTPPSQPKVQNEQNTQTASKTFQPKDYSYLLGMPGFSNEALNLHFTLYQGYVKNTNLLLETLQSLSEDHQQKTPTYSELKRRLGWEFDGMRLHELYFGNLGGNGVVDPKSPLYDRIKHEFGSFDQWKEDFVGTGMMRGIGWVVLYQDPVSGRLVNTWINEHDTGHFAGSKPILIMDVFEHAYLPDYKLERNKYIDAFFKNIDWDLVNQRYQAQKYRDQKKDTSPR